MCETRRDAGHGFRDERSRSSSLRRAKKGRAFYTCQQVADGELYLKKKEAEGVAAVAEAQGFYLRNLLKEANGNYAAVSDYIMIYSGMFQEIAKINAQAVQGLQPKISVWSGANNGGGEGGAGGGGMKDVAGVYSMLPPLFQTVHEQTGMLWLGTLPSSS
ncbi:Flotillin-like protein 6 [Camellia lanceoleosa]|uniref:Flotillin-like protein 6 n=1 Tax=Camellia lanceoleosa TaxID=1840588 RepID=A0ACC0HC74_9ERIC|nr:Flotillin-like protein 6 [Camellia lanceoleosa]